MKKMYSEGMEIYKGSFEYNSSVCNKRGKWVISSEGEFCLAQVSKC